MILPPCRRMAIRLLVAPLLAMLVAGYALADEPSNGDWTRVTVDGVFRSEGIATADVTRDGKLDLMVGDLWYAAPDWKPHEIRKAGQYRFNKNYSNAFNVFAWDVNGDGWQDQIVVCFPGTPCFWYENPQNKPGHWKEHEIWHEASNESPQFADLDGDGRPELILGSDRRLGFLSIPPAGEATKKWKFHAISRPGDDKKNGSFKYYHGLGVGDVNKDGRDDVLIAHGWYEAPKNLKAGSWKFHPVAFTPKGAPKFADMHVEDLDMDGDNDVLMSSAHGYGVWWCENLGSADGNRFKQHDISRSFSQTHALRFVDINGDGQRDLVTGKRYFAHGGNDPGGKDPAVMYWFEIKRQKGSPPNFTPHEIVAGRNTGIGTQFEVRDINGDHRPDIILSNKKGVHLLVQKGSK